MNPEPVDLDAVDRSLLRLLQEDGRRTTLDLAARVGLSPTGASQRVKRLFRDGFITAVRAVLNPAKIGRGMLVFIGCGSITRPRISLTASPRRWQRRPRFWNATWSSAASTIS